MTTFASTTHPVYRHRQDTGVACGRACAQMIISSLGQAGSVATTLIAVEQETLRTREANRIDIEHWWFTEPDELCALLSSAAELSATDRDWRVAAHPSSDKLLADLILGMQAHGRPAAVTTGANEHWMVLTEVQSNNLGQQVFVFLNPIPSSIPVDTLAGISFQHQFMDTACGLDQQPMVVVNRGHELADLNLTVKGITPPKKIHIVSPAGEARPGDQLPPPSAVGTYSGKAIGVTFGPPPLAAAINQLAQQLKTTRLSQFRIMAPDPVDLVNSSLRTRFRSLVESFSLAPVRHTLTAPDLTIRATRLIEDLVSGGRKYVLCSGYSDQARAGFVAAFDPSTQGELLHVQITDDQELVNSLARYPGEPLYWTLEPTSHFPPLALPYFVFRKKAGHPGILIRLYDNVEGEVIIAEPEGPGPG
jgi:hypothetical protein